MSDIRKTMSSFTVAKAKRGKSEKGVNMATAPGDMLSLWLELVAETIGGSNDLFEPAGR